MLGVHVACSKKPRIAFRRLGSTHSSRASIKTYIVGEDCMSCSIIFSSVRAEIEHSEPPSRLCASTILFGIFGV